MEAGRTNLFLFYVNSSPYTNVWGEAHPREFRAPALNQPAAPGIFLSENAIDYPGGWSNGGTGGKGFNPWIFSIASGGGSAGVFIGNPASAGIQGMDSEAFGLYANPAGSGAYVTNTLPFPKPLAVHETFSLDFGINFDSDSPGGNKGFVLKNGSTELIRVNNRNTSAITINGIDIGFGYGTQVMQWSFTMLSNNVIYILVNDRDGTGFLSTNITVGAAPDRIAIYASNLAAGSEREPYFDNFVIRSVSFMTMIDIEEGQYRFTLNDQDATYSVERIGNLSGITNLLKNPGFELAGSSDFTAAHWENGVPDFRGNTWGTAFRENYRTAVGGTWFGAVGASPEPYGGWYQDIPFGPDYTYHFTGNFYQDVNWTAAVQDVKVEFFNRTFDLLDVSVMPLTGLSAFWQESGFSATAPNGTAWARTVINASGAGTAGTLEFDNLTVRAGAAPAQSFTSWEASNYTGNHSRGGWRLESGLVTTNNARTARTALLRPGGQITSGFVPSGVGLIRFWYRNAGGDDENPTTNQVTLAVEISPNGTDFSAIPAPELSALLNDGYKEFTTQYPNNNQFYLRIRHAGGTGDILIDDISIEAYSPTLLYQDFNAWTGAGSSGCHVANGWSLCTGRIVSAGAFSGQSALLDPPPTNGQNTLTSPLYPDGLGKVTFQYARWTNGSGLASFLLQASTDATNWTTIDSNDFVTSTSYEGYERTFGLAGPHYLRVVNYYKPPAPQMPAVFINEGFSGGATPPQGWLFDAVTGTYGSDASSGNAPPSLKMDSSNDMVTTPEIDGSITNLTFWGKGQSAAANNKIIIEGQEVDTGNWIVLKEYTTLSNSEATYQVAISNEINRIRIKYEKNGSGNFALDDVLVSGITGSGNQPNQGLLVDNIAVTAPAEYREQNFDTWPATTSYGQYEHQGWFTGGRTFINSQFSFAGNAMRLDNRTGALPFIQSPLLRDEIGRATFKYRAWTKNTPVTAAVQVSPDGQNWTTITNLFINSEEYQVFEDTQDRAGNFAFRIQVVSGSERAMIDEINVRRIEPLATVTLAASINPSNPFTNDAVHIVANYSRAYGATDLVVTSYYRIGTSGAFTAVAMVPTNIVQLGTTSPIPPQPAGTIVQYYLKATFSGPGSNITSPVFYPPGGSNSPASYGISRVDPKAVWINEINNEGFADFGYPGEFIELAGSAGIDLAGWAIEIVTNSSPSIQVVGLYVCSNNTILDDDHQGYGFWVLGDNNTAHKDQILTNVLAYTSPLGIRLLNELGYPVSSASIRGTMRYFQRINDEDEFIFSDKSLSLTGTGSNYVDFTWSTNYIATPGASNIDQQFGDGSLPGTMEPPILIHFSRLGTQMTIRAVGNTNNWVASLHYTEDLKGNPPVWQIVTGQSGEKQGNEDIITFTPSTNYVIYRLLYSPD